MWWVVERGGGVGWGGGGGRRRGSEFRHQWGGHGVCVWAGSETLRWVGPGRVVDCESGDSDASGRLLRRRGGRDCVIGRDCIGASESAAAAGARSCRDFGVAVSQGPAAPGPAGSTGWVAGGASDDSDGLPQSPGPELESSRSLPGVLGPATDHPTPAKLEVKTRKGSSLARIPRLSLRVGVCGPVPVGPVRARAAAPLDPGPGRPWQGPGAVRPPPAARPVAGVSVQNSESRTPVTA